MTQPDLFAVPNPLFAKPIQPDLFAGSPHDPALIEEWKPIPGFPHYKVWNQGRFLSTKTGKQKYIKPQPYPTGYLHIGLLAPNATVQRHFLCHRLVAAAFCVKPSKQANSVNHRDRNRTNNKASNLEWLTTLQNNNHWFRVKKS